MLKFIKNTLGFEDLERKLTLATLSLARAERKATDLFEAGVEEKRLTSELRDKLGEATTIKGKVQSKLDTLLNRSAKYTTCACDPCASLRKAHNEKKGYAERMIAYISRDKEVA